MCSLHALLCTWGSETWGNECEHRWRGGERKLDNQEVEEVSIVGGCGALLIVNIAAGYLLLI
ncbi:MAG: hypothetical protein D3924_20390 [Candidatus Electrothrix sp. AR4]|nr:hypothetical protein [Candidatus Electrothrix sp. AR4]